MKRTRARNIVVIGGGITGLATAHALRGAGESCVTLLESQPSVGGNIRTRHREGFVIDEGPDAWLTTKREATQLARDLGLGDSLVSTNVENRRAYLATGNAKRPLLPLPDGLMLGIPTRLAPMVTTPILSFLGKLRAALDLVLPMGAGRAKDDGNDEAIGAFIGRRLGAEVRDRIAAPLLGGIYHGDVATLSLQATFPQLAAMEARGGLIRGGRAIAKKAPAGGSPFISLRGGLGEMIGALAKRLGPVVRCGVRVTRIDALPEGDVRGRYAIEIADGAPLFADELIIALPAHAAAQILSTMSPTLSTGLSAINYASTATVFLAYDAATVPRRLDAVGYLVPPTLDRDASGATFVSSKWPARAPEGAALLRVFFPSSHELDVTKVDDATLIERARAELNATLGITGAPTLTHVARFSRATPLPQVGHLARIAAIKRELGQHAGLHLAGSGYDGFGIGDCVRQANELAAAIVARA